MTVSLNFSLQELKALHQALTMGIIHSQDDNLSEKFRMMERQITLIATALTPIRQQND